MIITEWFIQFKQGELFAEAFMLPDTTFRKSDSHLGGVSILHFYLSETGLSTVPVKALQTCNTFPSFNL